MFDVKKIEAKISDVKASASALLALVEGREDAPELSSDEKVQFDAWMNELGNDEGDLSGLYADLASAKTFQDRKASLTKVVNVVPVPATPKVAASVSAKVGVYNKLKAFSNPQSAYDCGKWIQASIYGNENAKQHCLDNGIDMVHTEGTPGAGGYLVPNPLAQIIIDVVELSGIARGLSRVIPMSADSLKVPKRSGGLTVDYPGEATAITGSTKAWTEVSLLVVKRAVMAKLSSELAEDALVSVVDDLVMEVGRALGLQEDNEWVNGDGTGTYGGETGLISALGAGGKVTKVTTAWSALTIADFHSLKGLLPEKHQAGASWLMRREFHDTVVAPILYALGGNTVANGEGGTGASFLGNPITFTDQMPAEAASVNSAMFGNFRDAVIIGDRRMVTLARSSEFAFDEDVTTLRATSRYDINVHEAGGASLAGAYVGLIAGV